ncbi:hypothetical protein V8G54_011305 [Vigna mungo]|uniref:HAT C-terminal dimerisation domain-containing protein n=1 Tax=Vigna mungo TaxID=3915 RepID=A0AAQ3NNW6_VIGMU
MRNNLTRCKENPNRESFKRQRLLPSTIEVSVSSSPTISKFDQNASRMKLVKMFVKSELSFRFVKNEDFCDFVWSLQPQFEVSSRTTLRREMWELYEEEKEKLKMFLSKQWELIAKHVEACLNNWELKRVLSITVDNATTNDVGDGLKEIKDSISKIRSVVKAYVEQEGISYKDEDWEYERSILPFLKMFYDSTLRISDSSYVTSHMYMKQVFGISKRIRQYSKSSDVSIKLMAMRMKGKSKLDFLNYFIDYLFESSMASELKSKLFSSLKTLYEQYQGIEEGSQSSQQESQLDDDDDDDDSHGMSFYLRATGFNSTRFPILANMAREVLVIPISTVASECAFNKEEERLALIVVA